MSAAMVCGKRCYFEEEWESFPLVTKKLRLTPLDQLIEAFPKQLCLGHAEGKPGLSNAPATSEECAENSSAHGNIRVTNYLQHQNEALMQENVALKEQQQQSEALMKEQQQQFQALMKEQQQKIEALLQENVALKEKEKEDVVLKEQNESLMRENVALKEQQQTEALMKEQQQQIEALMREKVTLKGQVMILKRGVLSKHERQKDLEKEVSTLKVEKDALKMQKQAQEGSSMHWRFHPDVH